jgi:DNA polymerase-3 subunit gamma/tau
MAKALNCETGVTATPCGRCTACTEIDAGRFVDLIELDAASNTQVDQMRELLDNALYAPTRARFKVYIIDEVHMLSRSAFNAMLKTLEEPPQHVKFILATTDPQKVPVTVLSRCLQFNLKQIPQPQIRDQLARVLEQESIVFEGPALGLLARAAHGSMRDGLSLLDQAIAHGAGCVDEASVRAMLGTVGQEYLFRVLDALAAGDGPALIHLADEMQARSLSFEFALQDLAALLHRLALAQRLPDALPADDPDRERMLVMAARLPPEDLQLYYQIALQARADLHLAPDEYAGFTMALLRMLAFAPEGGGEGRIGQVPAHATRPTGGASPGASPAPRTASGSTGAPAIPDWRELVAQLKVGGMARMLAQHCELVDVSQDRIELRVPEVHRHLLDKPYRDKLQGALEEHFGRRLRVEIVAGEVSGMTPAEQEEREREARMRDAVQAIDRDPFVRDLVETFDARVVDGSVRPVDGQVRDPGQSERSQA